MSASDQLPADLPPRSALNEMITGYWVSCALSVAAKLGIADILHAGQGPVAVEQIAAQAKTNVDATYRLLRALASVGVFAEEGERRFVLTPLSHWLRSDIPASLRARAVMDGEPWHFSAWGDLLHSIQTGKSAFEHTHDGRVFHTYVAEQPSVAAVYYDVMTRTSALEAEAVLKVYDFSACRTVVDVGGGHGGLTAAILRAHANVRGIVFDLPDTNEGARKLMTDAGLTSRCEVIGGSFTERVPAGGDVYLLKHIIHGWDDDDCVRILEHCKKGMVEGGKVLLMDLVVAPGNQRSFAKLFDLEMLVLLGNARERTESQFARLLERAGLRLSRTLATAGPLVVLEGVAA